jgi:hypothetical protein
VQWRRYSKARGWGDEKWGIAVPNVVVTSVDELSKLGEANEWMKKSKLVAKAHEAMVPAQAGLTGRLIERRGGGEGDARRQVGSITVTRHRPEMTRTGRVLRRRQVHA